MLILDTMARKVNSNRVISHCMSESVECAAHLFYLNRVASSLQTLQYTIKLLIVVQEWQFFCLVLGSCYCQRTCEIHYYERLFQETFI